MPSVCAALADAVRERPKDPVGHLATHLLRQADTQDAAHVDPYDAPVYGERRELVHAKAERERARAEERGARAEREAAACSAADARLRAMLLASAQKHESMMRS